MNLTIVDVARILLASRRYIVLGAFALALAFGGLSMLIDKSYVAEVQVAPSTQGSLTSMLSANVPLLGSLYPALGSGGYETQHLIAIATSQDFVLSYLGHAGLVETMKARTGLSRLLERIGWLGPPSDLDAIAHFLDRHFTVAFDDTNGIVSFRVRAADPAVAADQANDIAAWFNERQAKSAAERAGRIVELLQHEAENTSEVATQTAIYRLIEAQYQTAIVALVGESQGFQILAPALMPASPASPKPLLAGIIGFMVGGFLVAGGAILRELWRSLRAALV